jgi:hypothetical protein
LLHTSFREGWGGAIRVEHEPLQHAARIRQLFRCFDGERQEAALLDRVIGGFIRDVARTADDRPVAIFGNTLSHLAPVFHRVFGDRLRLLHLHRDPVVTAASLFVMTRPGWWSPAGSLKHDPYALWITPFDPHAMFPEYRERWSLMTLFDGILYQWLERHAYAHETRARLAEIPFLSIRSEDLFIDPVRMIERLGKFMGLDPPAPTATVRARKNQTWARSRERNPLREEWRTYVEHRAAIALARELGHPVAPAWVEAQVARYRLPAGTLTWLRHRTRYWQRREGVARWLRRQGLMPPRAPRPAGLPPRSLGEAARELILRR